MPDKSGAPHGGAALLRRTSVLLLYKDRFDYGENSLMSTDIISKVIKNIVWDFLVCNYFYADFNFRAENRSGKLLRYCFN